MKYAIAYPDYQFKKITDITVEDLRRMGAKAVAVDLDNTAVMDSSYKLPETTREWVLELKEADIPVVIVSNTLIGRAWYLSRKMGDVPFFALARKPHTRALRRAAKSLGIGIGEIAMIGDQLFTDVLSANMAGAISIRVEPIDKEKLFVSRFKKIREREKAYLEQYRKNHRRILANKYGKFIAV